MSARTKLVVGLGNPGRDYAGTRHNIGFAVVERLGGQMGGSFRKKWRFSAEVAEVQLDAGKLVLAKPQTFMNRSGVAVNALTNWLKIASTELLVIVDDADLPLGQLRVRQSGGSGGHNGLRSITESLGGNEEFPRLRVGIGRTGPVGDDITDHVLGRFEPQEREQAQQAIALAVEAVECCVKEGLTTAMNRFNRRKGEAD
ncbi:MAG TPA: aminoacyl-tRNA hydrolase [Verrucomicrobiae bacterium]|nr:aminoacyl-tRNA hydrolase [Verrucomicrobiae bacterium]